MLSSESRPLAQQASRAAFWNLVLLPLLGMFNLAFSVLIRRRFGLLSGIYDILLGLMSVITQALVSQPAFRSFCQKSALHQVLGLFDGFCGMLFWLDSYYWVSCSFHSTSSPN